MMSEKSLNYVLKWVAIFLTVILICWLLFEFYKNSLPGRTDYLSANNSFMDGRFEVSYKQYLSALEKDNTNFYAAEGVARSLMKLNKSEDALVAFEQAIKINPFFAATYANRGILFDEMGKHEKAIIDYEKALALDQEIGGGMHWLDRLLYDVRKPTVTIRNRLDYLKLQMSKPKDERILVIPEEDAKQPYYEQ